MGKFSSDASKLLEFVGGRENIRAVSHCVTRMRFVLGDESKATRLKPWGVLKVHLHKAVNFK